VFESVFPLMCACALPPRQFAQFYLILAHLQHCKFNTAYIYISHSPSNAGNTSLFVCMYSVHIRMVAQLHELSAQQNKHLLSVQFSWREHWIFLEGTL